MNDGVGNDVLATHALISHYVSIFSELRYPDIDWIRHRGGLNATDSTSIGVNSTNLTASYTVIFSLDLKDIRVRIDN